MPFDAEEMKEVQKRRQQATLFAKSQGVIIGESHDNPHGRGLVGNLIQDGVVDTLFMEICDYKLGEVLECDVATGEKYLGAWLGEVSQSENADLTQHPLWKSVKTMVQRICTNENTSKNPAKTTRLIEIAVLLKAQIYLVDFNSRVHPDGDAGKLPDHVNPPGPTATSAAGTRLRDKCICGKIEEVSRDRPSHSKMALLVGSAHGKSKDGFAALNMGRLDVIKAKI